MVSVSKPVTTLPSTVPPDMSHRFLSSFMLTRPMRPPVIHAWSPSSNAPTMRPPLMRKVSMLSPCCRAPMVPPVMTKSSRPLNCVTSPVMVPPSTVSWSSPLP
ncbi:hypothetical protein D3C71_1007520 [compost metagenome]